MHALPTNRRQFVRTLTIGGAVSILGNLKSVCDLEAQPALNAVNTTGQIKVKLSEFPVLLNENGSLRLAINPLNGNTPNGPYYPIMINRGAGKNFYAMTTQCQHQNCVVESFSTDLAFSFCFCHGSKYAIDGKNIGGPAPRPLPQYPLSYDLQDTLTIQIPGLGYTVDIVPVTTSLGPRIKLTFQSIENATYHVQFRQKLSDGWTKIAFSFTEEGAMDQTDLGGTGGMQSVWVQKISSIGFYAVVIELANYG
ncbi:MAG: Rieske (2Fe-2S) domain protein [Verrucomicrobiales bacterium]|nr:Rieske (2Fe-2S) domain protein [Verrucomicrobiales bacterium]